MDDIKNIFKMQGYYQIVLFIISILLASGVIFLINRVSIEINILHWILFGLVILISFILVYIFLLIVQFFVLLIRK